MRGSLLFLPFVALLVGCIATVWGSASPEGSLVTYSGWAGAVAIIFLWIALDFEGFKSVFKRKGTKYGASSGLTILLGLLVIIGAAVLSTKPRFNKSFDVTKRQRNTLSEQTVKILKGLEENDKQIEVTAFFNNPEARNMFQDQMTNYSRVADVLKVEYIDPQVENIRAKIANLSTLDSVIFKSGEREARITNFTEEKITNALVNVMKDKAKKIYFTTGHGEGNLKSQEGGGFETARKELESSKFEIQEVSLVETTKVPDDADLLVVAGAKYEFKPQELDVIDQYLKSGGALLVMIDAVTPVSNLNSLLEKYGVTFNDDLIILSQDDPAAKMFGQNIAEINDFDGFSPVTKDFARQNRVTMLMANSRSLTEHAKNANHMKAEVVAKTVSVNALIPGVRKAADLEKIDQTKVRLGQHPVIVTAVGKISKEDEVKAAEPQKDKTKETRIVAVGSTQFANNAGAQRAEHMDLFLNMTNYLVHDEDFISIRPKDEDKTTVDLSSMSSKVWLAFLAFIYPCIYLGGGILYWLVRRRA